jgi:hypothetical protein
MAMSKYAEDLLRDSHSMHRNAQEVHYTFELCHNTLTEWSTEHLDYGSGLTVECITLQSFELTLEPK